MKYKITIKNWAKHNSKKKEHHRYFMLSCTLFNNHKIGKINANEFRLWVYLLTCVADIDNETLTLASETVPKALRMGNTSLQNALKSLQKNQLLTYEIEEPLIKRREEKRKEKKDTTYLKEVPEGSKTEVEKPNTELNRKCWEAYREAYLLRYKVEPVRNASVNSAISQIAKRLGADAPSVIEFYLQHDGTYYLKTTHSIRACLHDAETLHTQWQRGSALTTAKVKRYEELSNYDQLMKLAKEGKL